MRKLDVCLTPELLHLYRVEGKTVVVVDILRATSCMVTGLANGVKRIIPVATISECENLRQKGCVGAAERDGRKADGFEIGNSPFSYMEPELKGKTVAVTTTNGTLAITKSASAAQILVGAFLNRKALMNYLISQENDVLILCAGWKGKVNLEDTLFAGSLLEGLKDHFTSEFDSAIIARNLFNQAKNDLRAFLSDCSHVKRLNNLNIDRDIDFCLKMDVYEVIPVLRDGALVPLQYVAEPAVVKK